MDLGTLFVKIGADLSGLVSGVEKANGQLAALQRSAQAPLASLTKLESAADRIGANTSELVTGIKQVNEQLSAMAAAAAAPQTALQGLRDVVVTLNQGFELLRKGIDGVRSLASGFSDLADKATLLNARIRLVTGSQTEYAAVSQQIFKIAQNTRQDLETTATLYTRLARSTKDLGLQQTDLARITETVNKAIVTSGATSTEAANGIIQFSQALSLGRFQGQDLKAVLEDIPGLGQLIADGLGVSTAALREMGAEGKLTSEAVVGALLKMGDTVDREFAQIPTTVGQAFTQIQNQMVQLAGRVNDATGITKFFVDAIDRVGQALGEFVDKIAPYAGTIETLGLLFAKTAEGAVVFALKLAEAALGVADVIVQLSGLGPGAEQAAQATERLRDSAVKLDPELEKLGATIGLTGEELRAQLTSGDTAVSTLEALRAAGYDAGAGLKSAASQAKLLDDVQTELQAAFSEAADKAKFFGSANEEAKEKIAALSDALEKLRAGGVSPTNEVVLRLRASLEDLADADQKAKDSAKEATDALRDAERATRDRDRAIQDAVRTIRLQIEADDKLKKSADAVATSFQKQVEALQLEAANAGLDDLARKQNDLNQKYLDAAEKLRGMGSAGDAALAKLNAWLAQGSAAIDQLRQSAREITIDIGDRVGDTLGGIFKGIVSGTRDAKDVLGAFKDFTIGLFGDIFTEIIKKKVFGLDDKLRLNFENDIPGMAQTGATGIVGAFESAFSSILSGAGSFVGALGRLLSSVFSGGGLSFGGGGDLSSLLSLAVTGAGTAGGGIIGSKLGGLPGGIIGSLLGNQLTQALPTLTQLGHALQLLGTEGAGAQAAFSSLADSIAHNFSQTTLGHIASNVSQYISQAFGQEVAKQATQQGTKSLLSELFSGAGSGSLGSLAAGGVVGAGTGVGLTYLLGSLGLYTQRQGVRRTGTGAGVGAGSGALGGLIAGGPTGAVIGAVVGAIAGALGAGFTGENKSAGQISRRFLGNDILGNIPSIAAIGDSLNFDPYVSGVTSIQKAMQAFPDLFAHAGSAAQAFGIALSAAVNSGQSDAKEINYVVSTLIDNFGRAGLTGPQALVQIKSAMDTLGISTDQVRTTLLQAFQSGQIDLQQYSTLLGGLDQLAATTGVDFQGVVDSLLSGTTTLASFQQSVSDLGAAGITTFGQLSDFLRASFGDAGKEVFEALKQTGIDSMTELSTFSQAQLDSLVKALQTGLGPAFANAFAQLKAAGVDAMSAIALAGNKSFQEITGTLNGNFLAEAQTVFKALEASGIGSFANLRTASAEQLKKLLDGVSSLGADGQKLIDAFAKAGINSLGDFATAGEGAIQQIIDALGRIPKNVETTYTVRTVGETPTATPNAGAPGAGSGGGWQLGGPAGIVWVGPGAVPKLSNSQIAGIKKQLQGYDVGGVVPGPIGTPQPILAHGRELMIPTHRPGSPELAAFAEEIARTLTRTGGARGGDAGATDRLAAAMDRLASSFDRSVAARRGFAGA